MILKVDLSVTDIDKLLLGAQIQCDHFHVAEQKDKWNGSLHTHELTELGYINKGNGRYHIAGINYEAQTGDIYVIPAGVSHYESNMGVPFEIIFMSVKHIGSTAVILEEIEVKLQGQNRLQQDRKVREIFDDIYDDIIFQCPGYLSSIDARIKLLYIMLFRNKLAIENGRPVIPSYRTASERNAHVLKELKMYILGHLDEKLNIEMLAQKFFYNPKYLSQMIKNDTGMSLLNYILSLRMEKSRELLAQTSMTMDEIAFLSGFSSSQHFHKRFKNEFNITPSGYRSQYRQQSHNI
ncbi:MAG: hypothetical protein A2Y21_10600 [Clostridiales bacterium GWC2_40_7]|nr:MAG: hypothetical protein A2Y21_10600 [Clostridiales bacterium GWC2_40_7]